MDETAEAKFSALTYRIIGCAIGVHREHGPGLLESVYEDSLDVAFRRAGLAIVRQPSLHAAFERKLLARSYRPDFVVNDQVVVEVKSAKALLPLHSAQLLTYLKLSGLEVGLLLNFNVAQMMRGVRRLVLSNGSVVL